jgi:hypothetical protein
MQTSGFASVPEKRLLRLIAKYKAHAHTLYLVGRRPYFLPCEQLLGTHCAELMEQDLRRTGFTIALNKHIARCPKRATAAILGLVSALGIILFGTQVVLISDPCGMAHCGYGCKSCSEGLESCSKCSSPSK